MKHSDSQNVGKLLTDRVVAILPQVKHCVFEGVHDYLRPL